MQGCREGVQWGSGAQGSVQDTPYTSPTPTLTHHGVFMELLALGVQKSELQQRETILILDNYVLQTVQQLSGEEPDMDV